MNITIAQIETLKSKGYGVELHEGKHSKWVGVRYPGQNVWHWFEEFLTGGLRFDHSYSQNTGAVKRGTMHGLRISMSIEGKINN